MRTTLLTKGMACIGGMIGLGFMIFATDYDVLLEETAIALFSLVLLVWAILPFVLIYRFAPNVSSSKPAARFLFLASSVAAASSAFFYWYAFFGNPDPQSGLIFLSLPFCQLIGFFFVSGICQIIKERFSDRSET